MSSFVAVCPAPFTASLRISQLLICTQEQEVGFGVASPGYFSAMAFDSLAGQLSMDLVHPQRLIFVPADDLVPLKPDGGLDWLQIKSILVLGIEDTHE